MHFASSRISRRGDVASGEEPSEQRRRRTPVSEEAHRGEAIEGRFVHLPSHETSPERARNSVSWLGEHLEADRMRDVLLMVSELVTNSVVFAGLTHEDDWIRIEAVVLPHCVRVEVSDSSPGYEPGPARLPAPGDVRGRGVEIVDHLADRWGYDPPGVSRIWFELRRSAEGRRR
jgi:anti-sigma regulatory factor (Ser/Thr protein kinase)